MATAVFESKSYLTGFIKDISASGCRVEVDAKHQGTSIKAGPVYLKINTAFDEPTIVKGLIRNQHQIDDGRFSLGLSFEEDEVLIRFLTTLAIV
ncbi:hypothetical protein BFC17_00955 [Alteromonas lipolytica]|uniref:PilZ domain-containing protein n=2 Tax=Alteromonas lipolytica TaxID=1856405 RepID=A0A1E8FAS0_9ALTE|nr:hypothetical protein BFC17_00955 [Alteromonas lipolytica]